MDLGVSKEWRQELRNFGTSYRNTAGEEFDKVSSVEDRCGVVGLARF